MTGVVDGATWSALGGASAVPLLTIGSRGAAVLDLQRRLIGAGYDPGPIDGAFGGALPPPSVASRPPRVSPPAVRSIRPPGIVLPRQACSSVPALAGPVSSRSRPDLPRWGSAPDPPMASTVSAPPPR